MTENNLTKLDGHMQSFKRTSGRLMARSKMAELCALLSLYRPDGSGGVSELFEKVWDDATKYMNNDELADFYKKVNGFCADFGSEEMTGE